MPSILLTDRLIDALTPPAARVEYLDTLVHGLALRVTPTGAKSWAVRYQTATGSRHRLSLGRYPAVTLKAARTAAMIAVGDVAKGANPAAEKQATRRPVAAAPTTGDTIADLAKEYIARHAKPNKRSWAADDRTLEADVLPHWATLKVRDLTRRHVRELLDRIVDRGKPVMANRVYKLIHTMLNFAVARDWVDGNVATKLPKPGGLETSRSRVLTEGELRLVWAACATERPVMCTLMRLRLLTAQRGGELAQLKIADVADGWITIPATVSKNKREHRVPLSPAAAALVATLPAIAGSPYLFPGRPDTQPLGDLKHAGRRVRAQVLAVLQQSDPTITAFDFRGHDLRRTASTQMAEAGIPSAIISRVLNHSDRGPRVTQIYNRYEYDAEKRIALETWARRLEAILRDRPADTVIPFTRGGRS